MLIKTVDGQLMYDDIQSTEKTMEDRIRIWETHEQGAREMNKKIIKNVVEARNTINVLKKQRAAKECLIERNENRMKALETRLKLAEERNESALKDTRLDQLAKEKERKMRAEIKRLFENQATYHTKIMKGLYKTETLDKQLHNAYDRDMRLKERMASSLDRLRYHVNMRDELKISIRKKLSNIKDMHGEIFELEPKIRESFTRVQDGAAKVTDLTDRVKKVEEEMKKLHDGRVKMIEEIEKRAVECGQKQKRSVKGPPQIEALSKLGPPRTPIEVYKIKKPEIIKAFEKYTQLYACV